MRSSPLFASVSECSTWSVDGSRPREIGAGMGSGFDVAVIGGGHAGVEAAAAAARMGVSVALVTMDVTNLGQMSCNPAIGGIGKGHLVREVDVFEGVIGRAADAAAIHHRMLNASKGPAVRGPRIQADRRRFAKATRAIVEAQSGLTVLAGKVSALDIRGATVTGLIVDGRRVEARAVVLATGTFLGARLHHGLTATNGGRVGEDGSSRLSAQVREVAAGVRRLKTGTPPRLDGRSIDWSALDRQASDADDWTMSVARGGRTLPQVHCAITSTTAETHDVLRRARDRSPLYAGVIEGRGPRYCPSIEDKIVRFADRDRHQIFLEPEGLDTALVYPNGISTSMPPDVQQAFVRTIPGLLRAEIVVPGYAVEYDYVDPRQLDRSLGHLEINGLFFAGQINGTTGYEEAAAQGLVAGMNAARCARSEAPIQFTRDASYIGVMVDDLTLQGVTEPYRMLTARSEYRLRLRADNAENRLGATAIAAGCLSHGRWRDLERRAARRIDIAAGATAADTLEDQALCAEIKADVLYAPYLARQDREIERGCADEAAKLGSMDFTAIPGLSAEMQERLCLARPLTLAEASRVAGITPAAVTAIAVHHALSVGQSAVAR